MATKYAPLMTILLGLTLIFITFMAWTYSQAQPPDIQPAKSTHIIVIIRDTSTMKRFKQTIVSTLPDLLFDGLNRQSAEVPTYNPRLDRISVVFAAVHRENANGDCQFRLSVAPQHFFRTDLNYLAAHPENKNELADLLRNSMESACAFEGIYFSNYLVRANAITHIQSKLRSSLGNIPDFSDFTILIADFETPEYNLTFLLNSGVKDVVFALEVEKNFPADFYYILSPKSWNLTVDNSGELVRNVDITGQKKLCYRISKAKSAASMIVEQSDMEKLRTLESKIIDISEEKEHLSDELVKVKSDLALFKEEIKKSEKNLRALKAEIRNRKIFGWLLKLIVILGVLAVLGAILFFLKPSRLFGLQVSIPER